ncbi:hypothetical protein Y888_11755 [Mixta calida B021323]|nr:hypothetical protein Y888_11755 [Mixta calida B021323]
MYFISVFILFLFNYLIYNNKFTNMILGSFQWKMSYLPYLYIAFK